MAALRTVDVRCPGCDEALALPITFAPITFAPEETEVRRTIHVTVDESKWRAAFDEHLSKIHPDVKKAGL